MQVKLRPAEADYDARELDGTVSMPSPDSDHRPQPTERELADYRATVGALMARCLERIRGMDIPIDAPPQQEGVPDD